jgi:hypothetical protein
MQLDLTAIAASSAAVINVANIAFAIRRRERFSGQEIH